MFPSINSAANRAVESIKPDGTINIEPYGASHSPIPLSPISLFPCPLILQRHF